MEEEEDVAEVEKQRLHERLKRKRIIHDDDDDEDDDDDD